jgi:serine/threonine protein kinase
MGATCVKHDKTAPKAAGGGDRGAWEKRRGGNGAARQGAGAGAGGAGAGRPPHRAANEKVQENNFGNCGAIGNNNNNGKPAGGGGIAAYKPSDDVAKAYFDQINELRRVAIATGVLPVVEGSGEVNSMKNNDGTSCAESSRPSDYPVQACPPLATLTVYQCQPLQGDSLVAKGMYSSVHLARLSVFTGTSEAAVNAAVPRHPGGRRASEGSSIVFSPDPGSVDGSDSISLSFVSGPVGSNHGSLSPPHNANDSGTSATAHYIIAMKEVPVYTSYSTSLSLEQIRVEVRNWTRLSAYSSRVLRCYTLEYVYAENVSAAVPEACCHYYPGLSNEDVRSPKGSAASPNASPFGKMLERKRSPSGSTSPKLSASGSKGHGSMSLDATPTETSGTPQKLRLYVEYAKYGTLRSYQSKDMPEKFNKRRLHELTARAYMRDVLLALLQVHECGELQYDLCAKSIFLNRPIHAVYSTYFPAYISDVPAGDLTSVTPTQLGKALGLLDPPVPQAGSTSIHNSGNRNGSGVSRKQTNESPGAAGNEPISGGAAAVQGDSGKDVNGLNGSPSGQMANISVITHDASVVPQVSMYDVRANNNNSNINSNHFNGPLPITAYEQQRGTTDASSPVDVYKGSLGDVLSPTNVATPLRDDSATGSPKKRNSGLRSFGKQVSVSSMRAAGFAEGDDAANHRRLNEMYCRYMDDFDFKRYDGDVPFPSPHDGIEAQVDADLIAGTMLPEELRTTPAMHVAPLQRGNLGGVALISPDHYVVKPGDPPHALDLRGRLPMVLSPSTNASALVCGNPHTTVPTFSPTPASNSSPSGLAPTLTAPAPAPLQHTMSSGTTMVDAAGVLGRTRGGVPLTKLNHASLIRRALAYGDADKLEDIPVHKYVTVTHAAPEVLHRRTFSEASDIYAFAMTFIELVTDDGTIMEDCLPQNLPKPKTRREKEVYDVQLTANLDKWYQTRLSALRQHYDAAAKEQELPALLTPRPGPIVVRIPEHLSDEARNMLQWCLQSDPQRRPTAAELLRSRYFMLGDWIAAPTVVAAERGVTKPPEKPWDTSVSFDAAVRAIGLPVLSE